MTQFLREINFWNSRKSKTAIFAILGALDFVDLLHFSPQKVQKIIKIKIHSYMKSETLLCAKMADFALLESSRLISRKI